MQTPTLQKKLISTENRTVTTYCTQQQYYHHSKQLIGYVKGVKRDITKHKISNRKPLILKKHLLKAKAHLKNLADNLQKIMSHTC